MSLREVQTAAARVVHVDRLDDVSMTALKARFRYHPLDLEELFSMPVEPSFTTYGDYGFLSLLWPDAITSDINELRIFVDGHQLTVVGDTVQKDVRNFVEQLHDKLGANESQLSAPELVHELLQILRQPWHEINVPGLTKISQSRLIANAQVIRQLGVWLKNKNLTIAVPQLIIDAHAIDNLADRPIPALAARSANSTTGLKLNPLLRTYAVASAVMVILVLVTLSVR